MIEYWNYWILIVLLSVFVIVWFRKRIELFEDSYPAYNKNISYNNQDDSIENRYINTEMIKENIKKDNEMVNNYELQNKAYNEALLNTFKIENIQINNNEWSVEPVNRGVPSVIQDAYKYSLQFIEDIIKTSPYLQIPSRQSLLLNNIDIVESNLVSYRINNKLPSYILNITMVLLRKEENLGKHIEIFVKADKMKGLWEINVIHVGVIGSLTKEQISEIEPTDALNNNINISASDYITPNAELETKNTLFSEYCNTNKFGDTLDKDCVIALSDKKNPHIVNLSV